MFIFHLVFATKSRAGIIEIKNKMVAFKELRNNAEDEYHTATNSKKTLYVDDLFSEAIWLTQYDYSQFIAEIIRQFNHKVTTYGAIIDYFLQQSPLPFRDSENQKSIYDSSILLFKKNRYINCSAQSFANYKDADQMIIQLRLPKNYLKRISMIEQKLEQFDLFNY